jgi:hypothetical protein
VVPDFHQVAVLHHDHTVEYGNPTVLLANEKPAFARLYLEWGPTTISRIRLVWSTLTPGTPLQLVCNSTRQSQVEGAQQERTDGIESENFIIFDQYFVER